MAGPTDAQQQAEAASRVSHIITLSSSQPGWDDSIMPIAPLFHRMTCFQTFSDLVWR